MHDTTKPRTFLGLPLPTALILFGCLLIIVGSKFYYIHGYGSDLPFWDQWDAEGAAMIGPSARSEFTAKDFLAPHNEHRIVFTRLLAFGLEKLNGQWDARLEMTANVFIHVAAIGLLLLVLHSLLHTRAWLVACLLGTLFGSLPISWENTLAGFQSQFYFLLFFSIAHLAGTFFAREKSMAWYLGQLAAVCAIFSMASGFFSAAVAVAIIAADCVRQRRTPSPTQLALLVFNVALIVAGSMLKQTVPGHEFLKAHSASGFGFSLVRLLAWPSPYWPVAAVAIVPPILFFRNWFFGTGAGSRSTFILAMLAWGLMQMLALAVARGGSDTVLSSRYLDLLAIMVTLSGAVWFEQSGDSTSSPRRFAIVTLSAIWAMAVATGIIAQYRIMANGFVRPMKDYNRQRVDLVRNYVATKTPTLFTAQPIVALPYPDSHRLASLLDDPGIRAALPASVRPSLPMERSENLFGGFEESDSTKPTGTPIGYPYWSKPTATSDGQFESKEIEKPKHALVRFLIKSSGETGKSQLTLVSSNGETEVRFPANTKNAWKAVTTFESSSRFKVVAHSSPGASLAFSEPVAVALGSWLCQQILTTWGSLLVIGVVCMLFGLGGVYLFSDDSSS